MVALNQLVLVCLAYVAGLFTVAFLAERAALRGRGIAVRAAKSESNGTASGLIWTCRLNGTTQSSCHSTGATLPLSPTQVWSHRLISGRWRTAT